MPSAIGGAVGGRRVHVLLGRGRDERRDHRSVPSSPRRSPRSRAPRSGRRVALRRHRPRGEAAEPGDHVGQALVDEARREPLRDDRRGTIVSRPPSRTDARPLGPRASSGSKRARPSRQTTSRSQPPRRTAPEPHADRPAEREAAEREALDPEAVEELQQVVRKLGDRVRAGRRLRLAVAAMVVAQDGGTASPASGSADPHKRGAVQADGVRGGRRPARPPGRPARSRESLTASLHRRSAPTRGRAKSAAEPR